MMQMADGMVDSGFFYKKGRYLSIGQNFSPIWGKGIGTGFECLFRSLNPLNGDNDVE